jgi:Fur family transcriptional regulator, ferric uptake regulator
MVCIEHKNEFKALLNKGKLKATPGRLGLLEIFAHNGKPISIQSLKSKIGRKTDLATLYRNAEIMTRLGLLSRVRLLDKKDYYELAEKNGHHHHLVCTGCGKVSDIGFCRVKPIDRKILKSSGFAFINNHSLEFFGQCKACVK